MTKLLLTPSGADKDWADSLELEYPLVKEYYEKYGVGLLTRYDLNRDLLYNMTTSNIQSGSWNTLRVDRMERTTEVDSALAFLDNTLLQYFTDEDFIRTYFPTRILVGREVFLDNSRNSVCPICLESDARVSSSGINSLHSIFSRISFAVSCKLNTIYFSDENYYNYKMDNLYMFICYLFERNDLYSLFGTDFYLPSMENAMAVLLQEMKIAGWAWGYMSKRADSPTTVIPINIGIGTKDSYLRNGYMLSRQPGNIKIR